MESLHATATRDGPQGVTNVTMNIFGGGGSMKLLVSMNQKLDTIDMKISELTAALTQVSDRLDTGVAEILALIDQLSQADPDLSQEGQNALDRLRVKVEALNEIVPDEQQPEEGPQPEPQSKKSESKKDR